jgi:DNA-binding transcriptional MerR regulator
METKIDLFSLEEAAQQVGVSYYRLWYALVTKKLPEPERVGRSRLFTAQDIERIKEHFSRR